MRWLLKAAASYVGSAFWWLTQQLYGVRILEWAQPMIPDWLLNPSIPTVQGVPVATGTAFAYGPPIGLFLLGTYFAYRGLKKPPGFPGLQILPSRS